MYIFVGNLSLAVTRDELQQEFVIYGKVTSVTLMHDQDIGSGQGRIFGYVEMPSVKEGESAIEQLQGKLIKGLPLNIIKALPITRISGDKPGGNLRTSGFNRKSSYPGRPKPMF